MGRGSVSLKKMDQNRDFGVTQNNEHRIKIYSNKQPVLDFPIAYPACPRPSARLLP